MKPRASKRQPTRLDGDVVIVAVCVFGSTKQHKLLGRKACRVSALPTATSFRSRRSSVSISLAQFTFACVYVVYEKRATCDTPTQTSSIDIAYYIIHYYNIATTYEIKFHVYCRVFENNFISRNTSETISWVCMH